MPMLGRLSVWILGACYAVRRSVDDPNFFIVQLADPQLGMKKYGDPNRDEAIKDSPEQKMLEKSVDLVLRMDPKPEKIIVSGDMQNFWPIDDERNLKTRGMELGDSQASKVKEQLKRITDVWGDESVWVLPGNHDLDELPTKKTYEHYLTLWNGYNQGQPDFTKFTVGTTLFIILNSQLFYKESFEDDFVNQRKIAQKTFLAHIFKGNQHDDITAMVVLSHIPPFVGNPTENHGWANWNIEDRNEILNMVTEDRPGKPYPQLWLCGHFHANVDTTTTVYNNKLLEVATTSSVGSVMLWDGNTDNFYGPEAAQNIAEEKDGKAAYDNRILDGINNFANLKNRIVPESHRSGMRIVEFNHDGTKYRHKWFTIDAMDTQLAEDVNFRNFNWDSNSPADNVRWNPSGDR